MKCALLFLLPLFVVSYVSAHGHLLGITIQGQPFDGNALGGNNPSVIRQVSTQDPNKGASNPALTCGPNSGPAALVADANPGDTITFNWRTADGSKWVHNIGPMLTYMANCGATTCDKFDQSGARWFKIDQVGRKAGSSDWVQNDLFNGGVATVQLPANVAPGNYLIRHEIIALHLATSPGGAEFYPACAQLKIGGNGNGVPSPNDLVQLPGAYSDNDPGIFDPSVFDANAPYVFPGPNVATFVAGGSPSSPNSNSSPAPSPAAPAVSSPASSPSSNGDVPPASSPKKGCRHRSSSSVPNPTGANDNVTPTPTPSTGYPRRHLGHIMRRMALENTFH